VTSDIAARTPSGPRGNRESHARNYGPGFWVKLILLGLINAIGLYGIYLALAAGHVGLTLMMIAIIVVVDLVYFLPSARAVPMKYLLPGLIFLFVYQIFVIGYTAYTAFTNYGDGHNSTKEVAIASILREHEVRVPDSPTTAISVVDDGESLGFAYEIGRASRREGGQRSERGQRGASRAAGRENADARAADAHGQRHGAGH